LVPGSTKATAVPRHLSINALAGVESQVYRQNEETFMARGAGKAPKQITWIICLILYIVALVAHFGVVRMTGNVADWAWIIGFGLLLAAVQVRGL
jgi:hypothetical protein